MEKMKYVWRLRSLRHTRVMFFFFLCIWMNFITREHAMPAKPGNWS